MTPGELRERILRWEDPHTEFKRELGNTGDLARDLVCFANSDGGQIIVGVDDGRNVMGVPDTDDLMLKVDNVAFNLCSPPVTVVPEILDLDGSAVVVLNVPKGDQRPYGTNDGRYYVRSGARCRRASREELLRLFQASRSLFYDEQPLPQLGLSALDLDAVRLHLERTDQQELGDDLPRLLRAWGLYEEGHPTVGGAVVFGRNPQAVLQSSAVVVGALPGYDIGDDFLDRKDLSGHLFRIIDQIEGFLRLHLRTRHEIVGFEPEKREEIPMAALREAAVNALVHRDYTIPGPVRIFVLADRVEVRSPGRPPNSVDAEAMRAGVHVPRNPHIYSRVAAAQLATRAGTGIARISRLLREHSGQSLGIGISEAQVVLTLPRASRDQ
ncbi:RNA-binding domain-containing protein [Trebonia sp.]|uniref:RNA-binding domain-containing protein n=1 Tax=Trebonia sp. TaxID=2767075 RepID=UPI002627A0DE|nr:RNA-binding domain-containing protein [Trebonia sp.]